MRPEPSAPEFSELQIAMTTPVYSYASQSTQRAAPSECSPDKVLVGAWDTGFCSCLNFLVPNCFMAWCCPWVSLAQITTRLGIYPFARTLLIVLALHVVSWAAFAIGFSHRRDHDDPPDEDDVNEHGMLRFHITTVETQGNFSPWYCLALLCSVIYAVGLWQLRTKVRERFQISGSWVSDLLAASCCPCCTITQLATHLKSYTPGSCDFRPPADTLPAFP